MESNGSTDPDLGLLVSNFSTKPHSATSLEVLPDGSFVVSGSINQTANNTDSFVAKYARLNEAPTDIALSSASIPENSGVNVAVGTLTTTDPDPANSFVYTLVSGVGGADNSAFLISGDKLKATVDFNFETKNSYSIRVRSTDQGGLFVEKVFTVLILNVNESPTDVSLTSSTIAENSAINTVIGLFSAPDPDTANTFTYALVAGVGSSDNASFSISGNVLKASASFDFETKRNYSIRVRATDQGGLFIEKTYIIDVLDVVEPVVGRIVINDGSSGRSQVTSLQVEFSSELDLAILASAFAITNIDSNVTVGEIAVSASYVAGKTVARLTFGGASTIARLGVGNLGNSLADGNYRLDIRASQVRIAGSNIPMSADYVFGGQTLNAQNNDQFFRLLGDTNGDGVLNGIDLNAIIPTVFNPLGYRSDLDTNGDGVINGIDLNALIPTLFGQGRR